MATVDLSQLPAPQVLETLDIEQLLQTRKERLLALSPIAHRPALAAVLALESDPLVALLQENTYRELLLRQRVNEGALACLLPFAHGSDLDALAANLGVQRLVLRPANPEAQPPEEARLESDAALRERAQMAFEGLSVAGPRAAYEFHARSADARITHVHAFSPAPCEIVVVILCNETDPDEQVTIVDKVRTRLSGENLTPLGDLVQVVLAETVPYRVEALLYLDDGPESEPILNAAQQAMADFNQRQQRISRAVHRSAISAALHVEGVEQVKLRAPVDDLAISPRQAAQCSDIRLIPVPPSERDKYGD